MWVIVNMWTASVGMGSGAVLMALNDEKCPQFKTPFPIDR